MWLFPRLLSCYDGAVELEYWMTLVGRCIGTLYLAVGTVLTRETGPNSDSNVSTLAFLPPLQSLTANQDQVSPGQSEME